MRVSAKVAQADACPAISYAAWPLMRCALCGSQLLPALCSAELGCRALTVSTPGRLHFGDAAAALISPTLRAAPPAVARHSSTCCRDGRPRAGGSHRKFRPDARDATEAAARLLLERSGLPALWAVANGSIPPLAAANPHTGSGDVATPARWGARPATSPLTDACASVCLGRQRASASAASSPPCVDSGETADTVVVRSLPVPLSANLRVMRVELQPNTECIELRGLGALAVLALDCFYWVRRFRPAKPPFDLCSAALVALLASA